MKLTFIFMLWGLISFASATYSQSTRLTFESSEATIESVFKQIESLSEFKFAYNSSKLDVEQKVSVKADNETIDVILDKILRSTDFQFKIVDRYIIISDENGKKPTMLRSEQVAKTVKGKVTDAAGATLPGVSVVVKGTNNGIITDMDGNYSLSNIPENAILQFSFIGMMTQEITIGTLTQINATMAESAISLDEVVITAFGIQRKEKELSYSVQSINEKSLSAVQNPNLLNALQGKIAGVLIRQNSGAPGSSPSITIRGSRSLTGSNQPLYVIDGSPMSGNIMDLNPDDIESVNVLKGPTAAALYGLRASNGVVIITSRRGESAIIGKPTIIVETGFNFEQVTRYPKLQKTYAQGSGGVFGAFDANSWGPQIDTWGTYTNQLGELEQPAIYNNAKDFFKIGSTSNYNFEIDKRIEKGSLSLAAGYNNQNGTIDNSGFKRGTIKITSDYDLSKKIKVSTSINFSSSKTALIVDGGGNSGVINAAYFCPITYNLKDKPIAQPDDPYNEINFRTSHDNIYWSVKNNMNHLSTIRMLGNIFFQYKPIDWLSFTYRISMDYSQTNSKQVFSLGSGNTGGRTTIPSGGTIQDGMLYSRQLNSNFNAIFDKNIGKNFNINFLVGNEDFDLYNQNLNVIGSDISIGGFDNISNTATQRTTQSIQKQRNVGFYGNFVLSWKDMMFLNMTGRNDIVSNMPRGNRSFFYPSAGLGFVFTQLFDASKLGILEFGKIRVSVAEVGQAGPIYVANPVFLSGSADGNNQAGIFYFPFGGIIAYSKNKDAISNDLQPENTKTEEIGLDLRFFKRRLCLDYSYYDSESRNQIFRVPVPLSTGYATELRNAGQMSNKGHEVVLTVVPIQTVNFSWNLTTNFSTYVNKVVSLAPGINRLVLGGYRAEIDAETGQSYPFLRGYGYARDPQTNDVVVDSRATLSTGKSNPTYGMPLRSTQPVNLGNVNPDFEFGFTNLFAYKNLSISAQVDWRKGGHIASGSSRLGKLYGMLSETEDRTTDHVFPGKKGFYEADGTLTVVGDNDIPIKYGETFYKVNQDIIIESNVYDASFIRLREVRISYDLPVALLKKIKFKSASIYLTGHNLWLKASLPNFDPEQNTIYSNSNAQGEEYMTYPQIISYGGGLRVSF